MQWIAIGLVVVVTFVWLVGYALAYINGGEVPTELSGLMAIVLGTVLGSTGLDVLRKARQSSKAPEGDERDG